MKPINPPIVQSTVYQYETINEMRETILDGAPFFYMRSGNPTVESVANQLAALEGADKSLLFSSGMAAISCSLLTVLKTGDHVVCHEEVFSQTRSLLESVLTKFNVDVNFVDMKNQDVLRAAIQSNTRVLYVETPSNPVLDVIDLASLSDLARERSLLLFVDSTNATPVLQKPLECGASLVFHSATKFLSGHSDVLCGVVSGNATLIAEVHALQKLTGGVMDPHAAYLVGRGLKTLELRMNRACSSALRIAEFLSKRDEVAYLRYPFLQSDLNHLIARKQMTAGGAVISFELKAGIKQAKRYVDALKVIRIATSLGGTDSTIEIPYELKRMRNESEPRMGLIRLSVGLENPELLIADLEQALSME